MLPFPSGKGYSQKPGVFSPQEIPKEMDIFCRIESDFLPEGKTFKNLTPEEYKRLRSQYRFSPFRPGIYQAITGISLGLSGM